MAEIDPVEVIASWLARDLKEPPDHFDRLDARDLKARLEAAGIRLVPEEPTPEMLAAAWAVVRGRYPNGPVMGPGPAFAEATRTALAASPYAPSASPQLARAEVSR